MTLRRFTDWKFTGPNPTVQVSPCVTCHHLFLDVAPGEVRCAAFPDGVPEPIRKGEVRHTEPYPGDRGIQWTPIQDWPAGKPWPGCAACRHYRGDEKCSAYPDQIPWELMTQVSDHLVKRPGQQGDDVFEEL